MKYQKEYTNVSELIKMIISGPWDYSNFYLLTLFYILKILFYAKPL